VRNKEKPDCLSIIDPHRQDNNISAGTSEIQRILDCFAKAHETLQRRLQDKLTSPERCDSLLEDILGGNFSAYELQRQSLYKLHTETLRTSSAVPPPPPAAIPASKVPPPPPSTPKPPQSVNASDRQTPNSVPVPDSATGHAAISGGLLKNSAVGADSTHRSKQEI